MSAKGPVLVMAGAFERLAAELAPMRDALLLMDETGTVRPAGSGAAIADPEPAGAWYGEDVWFSPAARAFLDVAQHSPRLEWLQAGNAGIDTPAYAPFAARGVAIATSHGFAEGMADHVLAGVLDHWQQGPERRRLRAARTWRVTGFRELDGSRWLVIGFGAVGRAVARRAQAFGARVTGVRRRAGSDALADRIIALDRVGDALAESDVVVLCTSLNAVTHGLAGAAFFERIKPGATLVNVARGALIDEAALLAGLARGQPGHAILDVFAHEPLPQDSPLWTHPQVAMTPHGSWASDGARARNDAAFVANLRRFVAGEPLLGVAAREGAA